MSHLLLFFLI